MSVLLITGAIDLRKYNVPFTYLVDYKERLLQYINSIEYAIDNYYTIDKIVFCENTDFGYDYSILSKKAELKGKEFEYLIFQGNYNQIQERGKGFGEGEIIKYALDHSRLLTKEHSFYKLTGRLIVKNMDQLIKTTFAGNALTFKKKIISNRPSDYFETFFFKIEVEIYCKYLLNAYLDCDDKRQKYIEVVFCEKLFGLPFRSFKIPPIISGIEGSSGKLYDTNFKKSLIERLYFGLGIYNLKKTTRETLYMKTLIPFLIFKRFIGIKNTF